ncbi:MAG: hypothetical protein U0526_04430 [Candidatus Saccharibacteria bacterium]|jgi:hypothetical protein
MPDKTAKKVDPAKAAKKAVPATAISQAQESSMRNYIIIAVVVCTLVLLGGGYAIYLLTTANVNKALEVRAQEQYISLANKKLETLEESEAVMTNLKKSDGSNTSDFEFVTKRVLPETADFQSVLTIFNTLEKTALVSIESIARQQGSTAAVTGSTTTSTPATANASSATGSVITVKATAPATQITSLLRAVERSARVMDFQNMKLSGDKLSTSLSITYTIYNLPKPSIDDKSVPLNEYESNKASYQ